MVCVFFLGLEVRVLRPLPSPNCLEGKQLPPSPQQGQPKACRAAGGGLVATPSRAGGEGCQNLGKVEAVAKGRRRGGGCQGRVQG